MKIAKISTPIVVVLVMFIFAVPAAHAADLGSPIFTYDPVAAEITVSLPDNSAFNYFAGADALGDGENGYNGATTYETIPGHFGNATVSEWIVSNDPAAADAPPCGTPDTITGDPATDYADCIAAIDADGGDYYLGTFGGVSTTSPGVFIDSSAAGSSDNVAIASTGFFGPITSLVTRAWDAAFYTPHAYASVHLASGVLTTSGFEVLKNSIIAPPTDAATAAVIRPLINALVTKKVVATYGSGWIFKTNYVFNNPSTPAAMVLGKQVDGWSTWKTAGGLTLAQSYVPAPTINIKQIATSTPSAINITGMATNATAVNMVIYTIASDLTKTLHFSQKGISITNNTWASSPVVDRKVKPLTNLGPGMYEIRACAIGTLRNSCAYEEFQVASSSKASAVPLYFQG